jgi:signal transduction histidine kinase
MYSQDETYKDQNTWLAVLENERSAIVWEERRRFSNELHDVVANHLNCATLFLEAARQSLPSAEITELIDAADKCVRDCWNEARLCAQGLRSLGFERRELTAVLEDYANALSAASGISVTFVSFGNSVSLSEEAKLTLLRVTQEAATNAIRHANPNFVSIELTYGAGGFGLKVSDDGVGFDLAITPVGIGLSSMRDRAQRAGGELAVLTRPGHGTQVILTLPYSVSNHAQTDKYLS